MKPTRFDDVKSSKTATSDLTHPPRSRYFPSVSTPPDPVAPTGDLAAPAGRPPRRASLLDVRFVFASEAPPVDEALLESPVPPVPPARPEPVAPGIALASPAPVFVTATMAELYRAQGMPERALEIYRTLLEREPGRSDLAARVRELQATRQSGDVSPPMLAALSFEDVRLPAAEATPATTADPSARAFLRALGDRRVGGAIAHDLGSAAAAIGAAPLQAAVALDDAFADWT